jgi:hypothetical protein
MKKLILSIFLCGSVLSASAQVPSYVPSNGLSGWWSFSGNANDESGNGNNGTVNGAKSTVDRNGNANKAYDFDGKSNFIEVPTSISLNLDKDFTISSWFNADSMYDVPGTVKMILSKHRNGLTTDGYAYGIWNNNQSSAKRGMVNFSGAPKFTADAYPKDSSGDVKINKWYHLSVTYTLSSGELKYYLNGSLIDTKVISYTISSNSLNAIIGAEWMISGTGKKNFFNGKIDDIGIWNRSLSASEVTSLYKAVNNDCLPAYVPTKGLVGWWPFCGNANDESGKGNNGNVIGATLTSDRFGVTNKAYQFNGNGKYIDIGSAGLSNNPDTCSFSLWTKVDSIYTGLYGQTSMILTKRHVDNGPSWTSIQINKDSVVNIIIDRPSNISHISHNKNALKGQWTHIVLVKKKNNYSFYIDGKLIKDTFINYNHVGSSANMHVGHSGAFQTFFYGKIDDIGIWERALNSSEINSIYNSGNSTNVQNRYSKSDITVYPNPAKDRLVIDFGNSPSVAGYEINIFDVTGKSVYNSTINKSNETIDLNTWSGKGVYFIKIYDKQSQQIENRKIVIQ